MSRHAIVDLAQVVNAQYDPASPNRLTNDQLKNIRQRLADAGLQMRADEYADQKLSDLRALYEPYAQALGRRLFIQLPPWLNEGKVKTTGEAARGTVSFRPEVWRFSGQSRCARCNSSRKITSKRVPPGRILIASSFSVNHLGEQVVRIEAEALQALADRLAGPMAEEFNRAAELYMGAPGGW